MDDRIEQLESNLSNIRKDFAEINRNLKKLASSKADQVENKVHRVYNKAMDHAHSAWEDVTDIGEEYYERAQEQFCDGIDNLSDCIREKPIQSLAIVAGVGFILGFLMRR